MARGKRGRTGGCETTQVDRETGYRVVTVERARAVGVGWEERYIRAWLLDRVARDWDAIADLPQQDVLRAIVRDALYGSSDNAPPLT